MWALQLLENQAKRHILKMNKLDSPSPRLHSGTCFGNNKCMLTSAEVSVSGEKATAFFSSKPYALGRTAIVCSNSRCRIMLKNVECNWRNKLDNANQY